MRRAVPGRPENASFLCHLQNFPMPLSLCFIFLSADEGEGEGEVPVGPLDCVVAWMGAGRVLEMGKKECT